MFLATLSALPSRGSAQGNGSESPAIYISYPPDSAAVYSSTVDLIGYIDPEVVQNSPYSVLVNGEPVTAIGDRLFFRTAIGLTAGSNQISVQLATPQGVLGNDVRTIFRLPASGPQTPGGPILQNLDPPSGATTDKALLSVIGLAQDGDGVSWVRLNGIEATLLGDPPSEFAGIVALHPGATTVLVESADSLGNITTLTLNYELQLPVGDPLLDVLPAPCAACALPPPVVLLRLPAPPSGYQAIA